MPEPSKEKWLAEQGAQVDPRALTSRRPSYQQVTLAIRGFFTNFSDRWEGLDMITRKINRGGPDALFASVRNSSGGTMTTGRAAMFIYGDTSYQDGYSVSCMISTGYNWCHFAGVVAFKDLADGAWGFVQTWGHNDSVYVGNQTGVASLATLTLIKNIMLLPQTTNNASWPTGAFQVLYHADWDTQIITTTGTTTTALWTELVKLPPAALLYGKGCVPGETKASTYTGFMKAFIKAL